MNMHQEISKDVKPASKTISFKLPRLKLPSIQALILTLLIVVGALQTAQLYGLNLQVSSGQASASTNSTVSTPSGATDSVTSSLPSMVGGC